jgi:hypothetical protein
MPQKPKSKLPQTQFARLKVSVSPRVNRELIVNPSDSLYKLANHITDAFGFYFDHAFGFHESEDVYSTMSKKYTLFADEDKDDIDEDELSVKKNRVKTLIDQQPTWFFHFDYGDDWLFKVDFLGFEDTNVKSGTVIKNVGKAPKQYS